MGLGTTGYRKGVATCGSVWTESGVELTKESGCVAGKATGTRHGWVQKGSRDLQLCVDIIWSGADEGIWMRD